MFQSLFNSILSNVFIQPYIDFRQKVAQLDVKRADLQSKIDELQEDTRRNEGHLRKLSNETDEQELK